MKVVIEEEAHDDLDEIHAWIADNDPAAADSTVERIFESIERLGRFPLIGHKGRARDDNAIPPPFPKTNRPQEAFARGTKAWICPKR